MVSHTEKLYLISDVISNNKSYNSTVEEMLMKIKSNQGLTLIEAMIWFALFAAVIYSAFVMYNSYKQNQNTYMINSELKHIYKNMNAIINYTTNDDVTKLGMTKKDLLDAGVYPYTLRVRTEALTMGVYGKVEIVYGGGSNYEVYSTTYYEIPKGDVCTKIVLGQNNVGWNRVNNLLFANAASLINLCGGEGTVNLQFWDSPYQPTNL